MNVAVLYDGVFNSQHVTLEMAMEVIRERYKCIEWQSKPNVIEVRSIVIEENGFAHVGNEVLFKGISNQFWIK